MKNRILSVIIALLTVLTMIPVTAPVAQAAESVSYIDRVWDATRVVSTEKAVTDYTVVTSETTTMSNGWYVVAEDVTISNYVTVSGTAHIILCDGKTLSIVNCLRVTAGNSVIIYGQKNDSGKLLVNEGLNGTGAGIGGIKGTGASNAGSITINGGTVVAKGSTQCAGIGGAYEGGAGQITINGGHVTAHSDGKGAGIGSGMKGSYILGQTITINGGTVKTSANQGGPGIGLAFGKNSSTVDETVVAMTVTINGGWIEASTKGMANSFYSESVAIGSAYSADLRGTLYINGGTIFASADPDCKLGVEVGYNAPGIGSAGQCMGWSIIITGGTILSKGVTDFGVDDYNSEYIEHFSLTNGNGKDISLRTVTLDGAANKTRLVSSTGFSYGANDVYTNGNKLYLYIPADTDLTGTAFETEAGCVYTWDGTNYIHTSYEPADCTTPPTCAGCGKTNGSPLGHDYVNGFCNRSGCDVIEPAVSSNGTYKIGNAGQLYWFAEHVSAGNVTANAVLTADITVNEGDLSTLSGPKDGLRAWMPIGKVSTTETKTYNGTFDGAGHTVSGLYFYTEALEASYGGLIGKLGRNGVVKNVTVAKSWICATSYAGAIVGNLQGGIIDNCHNESYVGGAARIGGIVGHISSGTVSNCTNRGKVGFYKSNLGISFDMECIGGIAGNNSGTIRMCTNYADIDGVGATLVAGIAGQAMDGKIEYSLNMATVNGNVHTGGISGWAYNSTLNGCINVGTVNGTSSSGSLIGGSDGVTFSNCYYVGDRATGFFETVSGAVKITVDQLYSGEIGYNLGWGQTLDGSSLPYPGGPVIYRYYTSTGAFAYTNDAGFNCYHKDGTATCMEPAVCSGCRQGYGEKDPSNHVGSDDGYFINPDDPSTHCKGCPCGEKTGVEKHDWRRPDGICTKCNAICGVDTEHNWYYGYCPECQELMPAEMDTDGFYKISTLGHLAWFAKQVNSGYNTINGKLTNNIETVYYLYNNYEPIGKTDSFGSDVEGGFAGIFDGQGYYIYGFDQMIAPDSDGTYGIFGTVAEGGVVRNLVQYSAYMSLGDGTYDVRAGLIAGQVSKGGLIENCYVEEGTLQAPRRVAGGIVGLNLGTVKNCYTYDVEITGYSNRFGGIVGDYQGGTVINCYTTFGTVGSTAASVTGTLINCEAGVSEERFLSGEIAYRLNDGVTDGTQPYYQKLNDSKYDYLPGLHKSTSNIVYGWVNNKFELYSNSLGFTLSESLTFGEGEELNIPEGATVSIAEGVILDVHVDTAVDGVFTGSGHVYCGSWSYFAELETEYHYRSCAVEGCEEVQRLDGTHTGGAADCTAEAVCDYCKAYYGGLAEFNHDWQDGICSRCGTETSVVAWVDSNGDGKYSADETGYSMLVYALSSGVSVKLYRDINEYFGGLSLNNQSVTVDLNGHVWNADTLSLQMSENATLTITDTSADKCGKFIGRLMIHEAGNSIVLDGATAELAFVGLYNGTLAIRGGKASGSVTLGGGALDISDDAYCSVLTIKNGTSDAVTVNIPEGHTLCVGAVEVTEIAAGESAILSYPHEHDYVDGICTVCGEADPDYEPEPDCLLGDIDGDGKINAKDTNMLKRVFAGVVSLTEEQKSAADIDGDGKVNSFDANLLVRIATGA